MDADVSVASEAFASLGSETRLAILEGLVADEEGGVRPVERSFTELFEATDEETTAGFSYHLRQVRDRYVEETEDGYRLTYAGEQVVRQVAAGTFTERVEHEPFAVEEPCPLCGGDCLEASGDDNALTVYCTECEGDILSLPFPPSGHSAHDEEELLAAFDRHHRHRISVMADGSCPSCGGAVERRLALDDERPRASLECTVCGAAIECPVTLTVLTHPAVVSLYHAHGVDLADRPLWNVGHEWRETVLSDEPPCIRVSTRVEDEELVLLVGRDLSVGYTELTTIEADDEECEGANEREEAGEENGAETATA